MESIKKHIEDLQNILEENEDLKRRLEKTEQFFKLLLANFPEGVEIRVKPNDNFFNEVHIGFGSRLSLCSQNGDSFKELNSEELDSYFS